MEGNGRHEGRVGKEALRRGECKDFEHLLEASLYLRELQWWSYNATGGLGATFARQDSIPTSVVIVSPRAQCDIFVLRSADRAQASQESS